MKQISQTLGDGKLSVLDVAEPRAPRGGILVETAASLISAGTERMLLDMGRKSLASKARERPDLVVKVLDKVKREGVMAALDTVRSKLGNPIPMGYSLAGRVLEVGPGTTGFTRGDRVACAGAGYANHAELNAVPMNLAVVIPPEVTDEEASFATVGAIALHGVRLVNPTLGETVAVIGLGLLGQITVSLLAAHGCDVVGIDLDASKVELALQRGARAGVVGGRDDAEQIVRGVTRGRGADAIVITASAPTNEPLVVAGQIARDRARISVVGMLPLEIPRAAYFEKELEVVVSRSYGPGRYDPSYEEQGHDYPIGYVRWTERRNLEAVLGAIATRRLDVASLITHRFPFDQVMDAYAIITGEKPEPHLGVVLSYPERPRVVPAAAVAPVARRKVGGTVGVAVVGTGSFASGVLVPALVKIEGVRPVATVSGRGLTARHVADRFGFPTVAADLDAVLAMPEVDLVVIATRHAAHAAQAIKALHAGRDVFLEKPAAINLEQLDALGEAVRTSGGRLLVGFNRRFAPFTREVQSAFASRRAGLVMTARINAGKLPATNWAATQAEGGRIIGEGCHFIDLMAAWAGAPPVRVSAHAIGPEGAFAGDDNVVIGLTFADGSVGTLVYTAMGDSSLGKESYEVFCEGTVARIDDWRTLSITRGAKTQTTRALRADKGHAEQLKVLVQALRNGGPSPVGWATIEAVTRATIAAERARETGAAVEF